MLLNLFMIQQLNCSFNLDQQTNSKLDFKVFNDEINLKKIWKII